jgi:uncharacterized protein YndB with AHSA1/START domain
MTADENTLAFSFELEAPPEKVWRALTMPALLERWLQLTGSNGRLSGAPGRLGTRVSAELVDADPPRRLTWRWRETDASDDLVTFTLSPNSAGGTALRLVHTRQVLLLPQPANGNATTMMRRAA